MGKVHQIGKLVIAIFGRDHRPAHFHVLAPDFEALIEIDGLALYRGALPRRHRKGVMAWAEANQGVLAAEWNRCNPDKPLS